jgi:hypothetical protein
MITFPSSQRARILLAIFLFSSIAVIFILTSSHPQLPVFLAIPTHFGSTNTLDHALNRTLGVCIGRLLMRQNTTDHATT